MKTPSWLFSTLISSFLLLITPVLTQASLSNDINKALSAKCLDPNQTAIYVRHLATGNTVYEKNSHKSLLPASTLKLVTTLNALNYLGYDYRFKTYFFHTGQRHNGVITGDLYIKGGGDPKLTPEKIWYIAQQLRGQGITRIKGNLIADNHFFDRLEKAPSWRDKRSQRSYDAKIGALSVNFNSIAINVQPAENSQGKARVWLYPESNYFDLRNTTKSPRKGKNTLVISRGSKGEHPLLKVSGAIPRNSGARTYYRNVDDPLSFAAHVFHHTLQRAGIKIEGQLAYQSTPPNAELLYTHQSEALISILRELLAYSSNFIAEQVLKTMAAEVTQLTGTHELGLQLERRFLRELGVDLTGVRLMDGSGLSRENRFTAHAMIELLTQVQRRFDLYPDFLGVLKPLGQYQKSRRLRHKEANGFVRAKTGSLNKVSTLAGYIGNTQGDVFAYSFFLNNNKCGYYLADKVEDKILNILHTTPYYH